MQKHQSDQMLPAVMIPAKYNTEYGIPSAAVLEAVFCATIFSEPHTKIIIKDLPHNIFPEPDTIFSDIPSVPAADCAPAMQYLSR